MRNASDLKFCKCKACRHNGMHTKHSKFVTQMARRKLRHGVKRSLKTGQDFDEFVSVPYLI